MAIKVKICKFIESFGWINGNSFAWYLGWVIIHLLLTLYTMMMICIVVDEYFVPSLEIIADSKQSPSQLITFHFSYRNFFEFVNQGSTCLRMWPVRPSWRWGHPHRNYSSTVSGRSSLRAISASGRWWARPSSTFSPPRLIADCFPELWVYNFEFEFI